MQPLSFWSEAVVGYNSISPGRLPPGLQRDWLRLVSFLILGIGGALCADNPLGAIYHEPDVCQWFPRKRRKAPLTGGRANDTSLIFSFSIRYPNPVGGGNGGYHGKLFYL